MENWKVSDGDTISSVGSCLPSSDTRFRSRSSKRQNDAEQISLQLQSSITTFVMFKTHLDLLDLHRSCRPLCCWRWRVLHLCFLLILVFLLLLLHPLLLLLLPPPPSCSSLSFSLSFFFFFSSSSSSSPSSFFSFLIPLLHLFLLALELFCLLGSSSPFIFTVWKTHI